MSVASYDESGFVKEYTVVGGESGKTIKFATENTFVDKDIRVAITTPAAASPTLAVTDITTGLSMGNASSGVYSPAVTIVGNVNVATAGWITSGNHSVSDTGVLVGTVNQSTMAIGNTSVSSGSTITPSDSSQTLTITEGYNAARTVVIGAADSGAAGEITSGTATVSSISFAYSNDTGKFGVSGSADVAAPTVVTPGYISTTKGTRNSKSGGATVSTTVDAVVLKSTLSGVTSAKKPLRPPLPWCRRSCSAG